jgi:histidyl-tRNA synthetase
MLTQAPKGTKDLFGAEMTVWNQLENEIRNLCKDFGVEEIRTPVFEDTDLFARGVGETTDIVNKEMYTFKDMGDRSITLKPEGTAGCVRAYIENGFIKDATPPTKFFYIAPAFRQENVQKGRLRQFHQFGVEVFGTYSPVVDAQVISMAYTLFKRIGLKNVELHINSIGCPNCRSQYNQALKEYIGQNFSKLCPTCKERFEKNPLRVLDCKEDHCKEIMKDAPLMLHMLDEECKNHFETLQQMLKAMDIPYVIDPMIVRGLDYYTKTVFEFISTDLGSQSTVCGGGRYDGLIQTIDAVYEQDKKTVVKEGTKQGAVGFGMGVERLLLIIKAQKGEFVDTPSRDIYIGSIGDNALIKAHALTYLLRDAGIKADSDDIGKSVKAQMKYANKIGAKFAMVLGDDEIANSVAKLKNMETGEQLDIQLNNIVEEFKNLIQNTKEI